MKRKSALLVYSITFHLLLFFTGFSQPEYSFKAPVLTSGTDLQAGAVYKFTDVKPSVNANVTILSITGGVTLTSIDENWTGFDDAFQPFINVPANSNGYVEFKIDFVNKVSGNPINQANVPVTCIDVDGVKYGDGTLYEQDQVQFINGTYDFGMTGLNLQVLNPPGWITIKNTSGTSYSGIDTAQKDVMATVTNLNISSLKIRIGALNTSPTKGEVRYRSVYFKRFTYSNSILLPNRTTVSFSGAAKNNGVELKGALSASHTYDRLIIERSTDGANMFPIGEIQLTGTNSSEYPFTYFDNTATGAVYYYRLRLVNSTQRIYELSNTIMIKLNATAADRDMKIVNTMINSNNPVLTIQSNATERAGVQITDMSGKLVFKNDIQVNSGTNSISLLNFTPGRGYFVMILTTKQKATSQKIFIQ